MTDASRRVLIMIAAVAVFLVLAAAIAIALIDVNHYKPQIEQAVKTHTGRTLRLKGDLGLSIVPALGITLPASSLSVRGSEAEFVSFASARVTIALLPLLRQAIVVESIDVVQARATLVRHRDGSIRVDDAPDQPAAATAPEAPAHPAEGTAAGGDSANWEVGRLLLSDATITLRDETGGQTMTLSAIKLTTGRLAPRTSLPLSLAGHLESTAHKLAGEIELTTKVDLDLAASAVAATDLKLSFAGTREQQPLRTSITAGRLSRQGEAISAAQISVRADGKRATDDWTMAASSTGFTFDKEVMSSAAIEASASLAGAQAGAPSVDGHLTLDGVNGSAASMRAEQLVLTARRRDGAGKLQARLAGPLSASIDDWTLAMQRFDGQITIEDPLLPEGKAQLALAGAMQIDARQERIDLRLASSATDARLKGTIQIKGFGKPEIGFEVDAERLDVDRFLPRTRPVAGKAPQVAGGIAGQAGTAATTEAATRAAPTDSVPALASDPASALADPGVDWSPWRALRLDGRLQIGQLQARGIKASAVRARVRSAPGRNTIGPASAQLYGGTASGGLTLDAQDKRMALNLTLTNVELGALARDAWNRNDLSGRGNIELALTTGGRSRTEMTRNARGTAAFALRDYALVGIDLSAVLGQVKGALTGGGTQSGKIDRSKRTVLSRLTGTITLADGVARNDDLEGAAAQLGLLGRGQFDLLSNNLDYTLRVTVTANPVQNSKLLTALVGITVPVHVSGRSDDLRYSISLTDVAADAIARRGFGVGATVIEEAEGFLGRILGRGRKK